MAIVEGSTKVDRDEIFLEYTKSICPVCKTVIDALSPDGARRGIELVAAARAAHEAGLLGYGSIIARR